MSRIGGKVIALPDGVSFSEENGNVTVKGGKGELKLTLPATIKAVLEDGAIAVSPANDDDESSSADWGLARSLLNNMVQGVSAGFEIELELIGVGYRAQVQGKTLKMNLGFSHDVDFPIPEGVEIKCAKPTHLIISGIDKQLVGETAARIRKYRKPEPYKGKGIRYINKYGNGGEYVRRKEGKKK